MSVPKYPAYKDGAPWSARVPVHWLRRTLQDAAVPGQNAFVDGPFGSDLKNEEYSEEGVPLIQLNNIKVGSHDLSNLKYIPAAKAEQLSRHIARAGDLVVAKMADPVARAAVVRDDFDRYVIVADCVRLSVDERCWNPKFLQYWINSGPVLALAASLSTGTGRLRISLAVLRKLPIFQMPLREQEAIVSFLDHETSKIDLLISEQEKLTALLDEKQDAIILKAVRRGLNASPVLKHSGDDWLGAIPAHWNAATIAKVTRKITNGFVGPTRDILVAGGVPYIQATHIKGGQIKFGDDYFVTEEWSRAHSKSILRQDDVLIVQTGAGTGDVGLVKSNEAGYNCHALIILSPDTTVISGEFLSVVLRSPYGRQKLASIQTGAMHPHLNCGHVKFVQVPVPPKNEQAEIVSWLQGELSRRHLLKACSEDAVRILKERRSALIDAVVTGQIDVRSEAKDWAACGEAVAA